LSFLTCYKSEKEGELIDQTMLESTLENCQSNTYYDVDASQRCTYNREKDTSSLSEQGGKSSIGMKIELRA